MTQVLRIDRKSTAILTITLIRLDDAMSYLGGSDWMTTQILQSENMEINQLIDH